MKITLSQNYIRTLIENHLEANNYNVKGLDLMFNAKLVDNLQEDMPEIYEYTIEAVAYVDKKESCESFKALLAR